jgi:hypothetical protein
MNLTSEYTRCGRTVVTDNGFTSCKLGKDLLESQTYLLGTLNPRRVELPKQFIAEKAEVKTYILSKKHILGRKIEIRLS